MEGEHGIIIVGGGICGLAMALALHQKGIASLVVEKSETLRADGVSINVYENGWRVLDQLGVADELRGTANRITAYRNLWLQGNKRSLTPIRQELRCLKRKDLIDTLAKNIPAQTFRFGCHIASIHSDPGSHATVLRTVSGATMKAKVLIGCDGANSVVAKYVGLSAPKKIPRMILRGFTRYPHAHPFGTEIFRILGGDVVFGCLPITDNLVGFFVDFPDPSADMIDDMSIFKNFVISKLRECPEEITGVIQNSDLESLHIATKLYYRHPGQLMFGSFQKGPVTVAGDAMHVMGPFIGQGGAAGLEDAIVLARWLWRAAPRGLDVDGDRNSGEPRAKRVSAAIREYIQERKLRVALLSFEAFVMGALMRAKMGVAKVCCIIVLAILGHKSFRHANYDCGRL